MTNAPKTTLNLQSKTSHLSRGSCNWKCRPGGLQGGGAVERKEVGPHGGMRFLKRRQREEERSGQQRLRKRPPLRGRRGHKVAKNDQMVENQEHERTPWP